MSGRHSQVLTHQVVRVNLRRVNRSGVLLIGGLVTATACSVRQAEPPSYDLVVANGRVCVVKNPNVLPRLMLLAVRD
jgi:hypothetical protein